MLGLGYAFLLTSRYMNFRDEYGNLSVGKIILVILLAFIALALSVPLIQYLVGMLNLAQ
jgi:hypothetical protein